MRLRSLLSAVVRYVQLLLVPVLLLQRRYVFKICALQPRWSGGGSEEREGRMSKGCREARSHRLRSTMSVGGVGALAADLQEHSDPLYINNNAGRRFCCARTMNDQRAKRRRTHTAARTRQEKNNRRCSDDDHRSSFNTPRWMDRQSTAAKPSAHKQTHAHLISLVSVDGVARGRVAGARQHVCERRRHAQRQHAPLVLVPPDARRQRPRGDEHRAGVGQGVGRGRGG